MRAHYTVCTLCTVLYYCTDETISLSQVIEDQSYTGFGTVAVTEAGIQNGPDGLALVNSANVVVQFLSYGGGWNYKIIGFIHK